MRWTSAKERRARERAVKLIALTETLGATLVHKDVRLFIARYELVPQDLLVELEQHRRQILSILRERDRELIKLAKDLGVKVFEPEP